MKRKLIAIISTMVCFTVLFTMLTVNVQADITLTSNQTGTHGGYDFGTLEGFRKHNYGSQRRWSIQLLLE